MVQNLKAWTLYNLSTIEHVTTYFPYFLGISPFIAWTTQSYMHRWWMFSRLQSASRNKIEISWCLLPGISKCKEKIIIETLLQWDVKKEKAKGVGILGTTDGFAPADEEQGRGTLHSHWQIWIKELNQKVRAIYCLMQILTSGQEPGRLSARTWMKSCVLKW